MRESVLSLLGQTHAALRIIVISDGEGPAPWTVLADLHDPRLVRFELARNRGPYFCRAIAAAASPDDYFFVQDADDWSAPDHVARLLATCLERQADFVFAAQAQYAETSNGPVFETIAFPRGPRLVDSPAMLYRAPHHGLFRRKFVEQIGGFFGGYRFGYDLLFTNVVAMTGRVAWIDAPLYSRRRRAGSLTESSDTGYGSPARRRVDAQLSTIYANVFPIYCAYRDGRLSREALQVKVRELLTAAITPRDRESIVFLADRLRGRISGDRE